MDNHQRIGDMTHMSQSEIASEFENVVSIHQGRLYLLDRNWSVVMAIAVFGLPTFAIIIICLLRMRLSHIEQHMSSRDDNETVSLLTLEDGSHIALLGQRSEGSDLDSLEGDSPKPYKSGQGHSVMANGMIKVKGNKYGRRCLATATSNSSTNTEEVLVVILNEDCAAENNAESQSIKNDKKNTKKKTIGFALADEK